MRFTGFGQTGGSSKIANGVRLTSSRFLPEPAQSDLVGQGSTRAHMLGKSECTPEGGALAS